MLCIGADNSRARARGQVEDNLRGCGLCGARAQQNKVKIVTTSVRVYVYACAYKRYAEILIRLSARGYDAITCAY